MAVKPVPAGYATITPYLVVKGASEAMEWYKKALNALEVTCMQGPDGRIMHGELRIGTSVIMLCDEFPEMPGAWSSPQSLGGTCVALWFYADDCDLIYRQAMSAGAVSVSAPSNMYWGDRHARFNDPFGHAWNVATHIEDVAPADIEKRQKEWLSKATPAS